MKPLHIASVEDLHHAGVVAWGDVEGGGNCQYVSEELHDVKAGHGKQDSSGPDFWPHCGIVKGDMMRHHDS